MHVFHIRVTAVKKLPIVTNLAPTSHTSALVYWMSLCILTCFFVSLLNIVIAFLRPFTRLFPFVFFYSRYRTVKVLNALGSPFLTPVGTPDTMSESGSVKSARSRRSVPAFSNLLIHLLCSCSFLKPLNSLIVQFQLFETS